VSGRLDGTGGVSLYWQGWLPVTGPTGLLLICHGLGEHSGRYRTVVDELLPHGWAIYGLDLRGHGRSGGRRTHLEDYAHWLTDLDRLRQLAVGRHPGLPTFLLGHSMGGQIALAYALAHQDELTGLVLTAPALASAAVPRALVGVLKRLARLAPTWRPTGIDPSKISKDPDVVADYRADPLVHHGNPTLGLSTRVVQQFDVLPERARALRLPVLLQHGLLDQLTDPAGSRHLADNLTAAPLTVRWYEGLWHEIRHEPERARPLADLREWLAAQR
jgi:acylglycerol lipase